MGRIHVEADIVLPDKKKLCLIKLVGVNPEKFYGKRGNVLSRHNETYWRCRDEIDKNKFWVDSLPDKEESNFSFKVLKQFSLSSKDIYFRFQFFGMDLRANRIPDLIVKVGLEIKDCEKHIEQCKKSKINLMKLKKELEKFKEAE